MINKAIQARSFLSRMKAKKIPLNQAIILFYIYENKDCEQMQISYSLSMDKNVLSNAMGILIAKKYVLQKKLYGKVGNCKTHRLSKLGLDLVEEIL